MADMNLEQKVDQLVGMLQEVRDSQVELQESQDEIIEKLIELGPDYFNRVSEYEN